VTFEDEEFAKTIRREGWLEEPIGFLMDVDAAENKKLRKS